MHTLLCSVLIIATRFLAIVFSYGAISILIATAGRLKSTGHVQKAILWLFAGAALAYNDLHFSSLRDLDLQLVSDQVLGTLSIVAFFLTFILIGDERYGDSFRWHLENLLGESGCKLISWVMSVMSRYSLWIYNVHIVLFYAMGGIRN
jgi:hypothetical protein